MIRASLFFAALAVALLGDTVLAQNRNGFGVGIIVGEPTGLAGKVWMGEGSAFAGAAAWSFKEEAAVHLHLDYLIHKFDMIRVARGSLPVYFGVGGRVKLQKESRVSLRLPVGLNYLCSGAPVDLFLEIVPMLDMIPETEFVLNAGIGVRYFL